MEGCEGFWKTGMTKYLAKSSWMASCPRASWWREEWSKDQWCHQLCFSWWWTPFCVSCKHQAWASVYRFYADGLLHTGVCSTSAGWWVTMEEETILSTVWCCTTPDLSPSTFARPPQHWSPPRTGAQLRLMDLLEALNLCVLCNFSKFYNNYYFTYVKSIYSVCIVLTLGWTNGLWIFVWFTRLSAVNIQELESGNRRIHGRSTVHLKIWVFTFTMHFISHLRKLVYNRWKGNSG